MREVLLKSSGNYG